MHIWPFIQEIKPLSWETTKQFQKKSTETNPLKSIISSYDSVTGNSAMYLTMRL